MYLTLNEAAKKTGKSKSTISKYLKDGKLSYVEKTDDGYKIDPSELFRVFDKSEQEEQQIEQTRTTVEHINEHPSHTAMEKEIEMLRERLTDKESENEKLWEKLDNAEQRIDKLTDTISKQTILLTDQRQKPPEKPVQRPKGFFATLLRKSA